MVFSFICIVLVGIFSFTPVGVGFLLVVERLKQVHITYISNLIFLCYPRSIIITCIRLLKLLMGVMLVKYQNKLYYITKSKYVVFQ